MMAFRLVVLLFLVSVFASAEEFPTPRTPFRDRVLSALRDFAPEMALRGKMPSGNDCYVHIVESDDVVGHDAHYEISVIQLNPEWTPHYFNYTPRDYFYNSYRVGSLSRRLLESGDQLRTFVSEITRSDRGPASVRETDQFLILTKGPDRTLRVSLRRRREANPETQISCSVILP